MKYVTVKSYLFDLRARLNAEWLSTLRGMLEEGCATCVDQKLSKVKVKGLYCSTSHSRRSGTDHEFYLQITPYLPLTRVWWVRPCTFNDSSSGCVFKFVYLLTVTFCDSTLNTANLCPAISVVGLFYLLIVIMNFVCRFILGVDFTRRFRFCMCA